MKKYLFSALAALLLISVLIGMTGCSNEADALVGSWEGEVNYAQYFNEGIVVAAGEELAQYWMVEDFSLTLVMTFRADGTYSMTVDQIKLEDTIANLKTKLTKGLTDYMRDLIEASGSEMTVDEFMSTLDISVDELIDQTLGDQMINAMVADCTFEGNYEVKEGKLYTSAGLDFSIDKNVYEVYEITQNTLTLMSLVSSGDTARLDAELYPITLIRVTQ